jgi:hypothetical protein
MGFVTEIHVNLIPFKLLSLPKPDKCFPYLSFVGQHLALFLGFDAAACKSPYLPRQKDWNQSCGTPTHSGFV